MKIIDFCPEPFFTFPFLNAGKGAGQFVEDRLPVNHARVDRLPRGVSAIVVTSDLQGRERFQDAPENALRLLGEVLPRQLLERVLPTLGVADLNNVAALLAGDFYTVPALDKRGGTGDVTDVWRAFGECFTWVTGVAGNHDLFGDGNIRQPSFEPPLYYLDGQTIEVDSFHIGGIGGIIGNPSRPQRRTEDDYLRTLKELLSQPLDVLLMHEGPDGPGFGQRGDVRIRTVLENRIARDNSCLVIRGHKHWNSPLAQLSRGLQVLNVDARVVILTE
jgi:Icc protein